MPFNSSITNAPTSSPTQPVTSSPNDALESATSPGSVKSTSKGDRSRPASVASKGCITSASTLACKPEDFKKWASIVKLQLEPSISFVIPPDPCFQAIRRIQSASVCLPSWLGDETSSRISHLPSVYRNLLERVRSLIKTDICSLDKNDIPDLPSALPIILQICNHQARLRAAGKQHSEMDIRIGIDALMLYSCDMEEGHPLTYNTEQTLKLPSAATEAFDVTGTTADGVHTLDIPNLRVYLNLEFRKLTSAIKEVHLIPPATFAMIHCVTEYKREGSGVNQVMMGMVSGLYQKKILGLKQLVFGIYQCGTDFVEVVSATWHNSMIKTYLVGSYSFHCPLQMIQFYLVLRQIKHLGSEYADELTKSDGILLRAFRENPPKNVWDRSNLPTVPETPEESNIQGGHGGPSGKTELSDHLSALGQFDSSERISDYIKSLRSFPMNASAPLVCQSYAIHTESSVSSDDDLESLKSPPLGELPMNMGKAADLMEHYGYCFLPGNEAENALEGQQA
ncbi:hypothetical protein RHS02_09846, partial [Rhizoctonia solani]